MQQTSINPHTGQPAGSVALLDGAGLEQRLSAAQAAFAHWSCRGLEQRAEVLMAIARALRAHAPVLQQAMTAEMGKLAREALAEIEKSARCCEHFAEHAAGYLADEVVPTEAADSRVVYQPLGAVLAVMPWNFPVWQVVRCMAPALMAGNVVLLKHAANVPQCAALLGEVMAAAGLPAGVFSVLHIDNEQAAAVIADARIAGVALTGSERAGRSVAATAGSHLKPCVMELGGSDAFIVLADADLPAAVAAATASRFDNAGQTCIAAKRFIVVDAVADAFVAALAEAASQRRYGDPRDPATTLAPMARADLRDGLDAQVQASIAAGAQVVIGGQPLAGTVAGYPATLLDHVVPGMPAFDEELFGPVAAVIRARDAEHALALANASDFGLGGSIWTADVAAGRALALRMGCGAVFVNAVVRSDVRLPFGGIKRSGYGRELGGLGLREFTNAKTLWVG